MATDPICGMQVNGKNALNIEHNGQKVYFCSQLCLKKYQAQHKIEESCTHCSAGQQQAFYRNKLFQIVLVILAIFILKNFLPFLDKLSDILRMYMVKIAFPVLLGLFLGGVIEWLIPREYISQILSAPKKRTIFTAVFAGFLLSACSHGILALTIQLYKKGASIPAVIAFLLASPWANLPVTLLMFGFFGWKALLIVISALIIATITGLIYMGLASAGLIEENPNTVLSPETISIRDEVMIKISELNSAESRTKARNEVWLGMVSLADMVLWWILLGALLSSLAGAFIPESFMQAYMGSSVIGLLLTLALATVMEVCSEGTAPLAFEIYRQTGAFGNAFVFLMAGVVTDYTEIGLLWSNIGKRTAIWLPMITVPMVVVLGIIFNTIF